MIRHSIFILCVVLCAFLTQLSAQSDVGVIRADFELQVQSYTADSLINAPKVPEKILSEGFLNLSYSRGNFGVGLRYEGYFNPLQGIDPRYSGNGIPYRYARYSNSDVDVTLGNFYEQFGTGMLLRTYEDRALGFDNSLDGIRVKSTPLNGIQLTGLVGRQRSFFALGPGMIRGFDADLSLNDMDFLGSNWLSNDLLVRLGGSFISRYQVAADPLLNLPENVGAYALRASLNSGGFVLSGELAHKINDPSTTNENSFNPGNGLFITSTYSAKGLGITFNFKRIDNMDFRSDRSATGNNLNLSFLPALSKQHTYRLVTMYPYATQPNGEIGIQGELVYTFSRNSFLGGKYGTTVTVNYSNIHDLDTTRSTDSSLAKYRYTSKYFATGPHLLFEDLNIEISHAWSRSFKSILTVVRQSYNKNLVQGKEGYDSLLHPLIVVFEGTWQINPSNALRFELQHLSVKEINYTDSIKTDHGNWAYALMEYTLNSHWYFSVFDEWNYGNDVVDHRLHYPNASMSYVHEGTRFSFGYGKQRAGILCVGGVCRLVPAANGFTLSLTSTL